MLNVLWTCLELAANLFETLICIHFIIVSFGSRCRLTNSKNTHIIGTICMTAAVTALNFITDYEGVLGIIYVVLFFVFSAVFLRGTLCKKFFISILTVVCLISTATVSGNVLLAIFKNDPMNIYIEQGFERFIFLVIGVAMNVYVFALMQRLTCGKDYFLKAKEWILILSVLGISFFMIALIQIVILNSEINPSFLVIVEFGIIIINILCLYTTTDLSETHKREEGLLIEKNKANIIMNMPVTSKNNMNRHGDFVTT